jgi:hypothetical protein
LITDRALVREVATVIGDAADLAVGDLRERRVEQEPHLTDRMLGQIEQAIDGYRSKGVVWAAKTLTDHGPGAQERRYGADFIGVLSIDLPEFKVTKGFLAQAKLVRSGGMGRSEFDRMVSQCRQMLELSSSAFVFHQSEAAIRVIPALSVVSANGPEIGFDLENLYSRSITRFYEEHLECFIGDGQINDPSLKTLAALQARSSLFLAAVSSEQR